MSAIGTLREGPLHAALKQQYAESRDRFEVLFLVLLGLIASLLIVQPLLA